MADLPNARVSIARVFSKVGLDFCGPFHIKLISEFFTLVTQVEAVLNSRPLCSLSEDPNDDLALTAAHFLTGSPLTSLPDPDFKGIPMNRLRRWELVKE
ncbi:uncharacterized protein TNCV_2805241 [Trichonephila clavipes]|nr:uncharacterized protein TNCV_2805241 [Trichonephila clavipes]